MIAFQSDPSQLEPIGGTTVGVWLPALVLLISIGISGYLYWHFGRRGKRPVDKQVDDSGFVPKR